MPYNRIVISSGHGKYVPGAIGILDEHVEAVRVVDQVATALRARGVDVKTFEDTTSHSQNENLNTIVNFHNAQQRDLDVSVHFNAYVETNDPMGTECLYVTQADLSGEISAAISWCGFIDRGPKKRTDLFFLNNTEEPAILVELCFVDSTADAEMYHRRFPVICEAIARVLGGARTDARPPNIERPPPDPEQPPSGALVELNGTVSNFGGPDDMGVAPDEGLAFISNIDQAPQLFLPFQPSGTSGLARRLNPYVHYIATRWDYAVTPHSMLLNEVALVRAVDTGIALTAFPADWGPNSNTGRVADISPGLMDDLGIKTDDRVEVIFPWRG